MDFRQFTAKKLAEDLAFYTSMIRFSFSLYLYLIDFNMMIRVVLLGSYVRLITVCSV
jgi:hypothetical protein